MTQSYNRSLQKKLEEIIRNKYFEAFNFYFAKPINEILANYPTSHVILFKDYLFFDDDREFTKRYYQEQEMPNKLNTIIDFYAKNNLFMQQLPNLCIHEQNRIILKRNLKLHKIFLTKLKNYNEIPQTAREQYIARKMELRALPSHKDSESGDETETNCQFNVESNQKYEINKQKGSFKRLLDGCEQNDSKLSYESRVHNIYAQKDASEEELLAPKNQFQKSQPKNQKVQINRRYGEILDEEGENKIALHKTDLDPLLHIFWSQNKVQRQESARSIKITNAESFVDFHQRATQFDETNCVEKICQNDTSSNQSDLIQIQKMITEEFEIRFTQEEKKGLPHQSGDNQPCNSHHQFNGEEKKKQLVSEAPFSRLKRNAEHTNIQSNLSYDNQNREMEAATQLFRDSILKNLNLRKIDDVAKELEERARTPGTLLNKVQVNAKKTPQSARSPQHSKTPSSGNKLQSQNENASVRKLKIKSQRNALENPIISSSPQSINKSRSKSKLGAKKTSRGDENYNSAQNIKDLVQKYQRQFLKDHKNSIEVEYMDEFRKGSVLSKITMNDAAVDESLKKKLLQQIYSPKTQTPSEINKLKGNEGRTASQLKQSTKPEEPIKDKNSLDQDSLTLLKQKNILRLKDVASLSSKENDIYHRKNIIFGGSQTAREHSIGLPFQRPKTNRFVSNEGISQSIALAAMNNVFISSKDFLNSPKAIHETRSIDNTLKEAVTIDARTQKTEFSVNQMENFKKSIKRQHRERVTNLSPKLPNKHSEAKKTLLGAFSSATNNIVNSNPNSIPVSPSKHLELRLNLNRVQEIGAKIVSSTSQDNIGNTGDSYGFFSNRSAKNASSKKLKEEPLQIKKNTSSKLLKGREVLLQKKDYGRIVQLPTNQFKENNIKAHSLRNLACNSLTKSQPQLNLRCKEGLQENISQVKKLNSLSESIKTYLMRDTNQNKGLFSTKINH